MFLLPSCSKDYLEEGIGREIVGEWKLIYLRDNCESTAYWIDCGPSIYLDSDYSLEVKENGRITSLENDDRIWRGRLDNLSTHSTSSYGDIIHLKLKKEIALGTDDLFLYLSNDTL